MMCLEKDLSFQILAMQHLDKIQVALQYQVELQLLVPAAPMHFDGKISRSTLQLGKLKAMSNKNILFKQEKVVSRPIISPPVR